MKLRNVIPLAVLAVMFVAVWSFHVGAYDLVSAEGQPNVGNCNQCHSLAPGGSDHNLHTGAMSCATCHGDFSAQVPTSICTPCHSVEGYPDGGLFADHDGLVAPNGDYCGDCHPGVGVLLHSWSELKHLFE